MELEPVQGELVDGVPIRISDDDRNRVIDQLQLATRDGRLELAEFEDRARQVYDARFTADLVPLTADLPAPITEATFSTKPRRRWLLQLMGGNDVGGDWDPGDQTFCITVMGGQDIDLTEVAATEVTIFAFTCMGAIDIIVPNGATVDMSGLIVFGGSENKARRTGNSPMRVRVRSFGAMGACSVRNLKPKEEAKRAR